MLSIHLQPYRCNYNVSLFETPQVVFVIIKYWYSDLYCVSQTVISSTQSTRQTGRHIQDHGLIRSEAV